MENLKQAVASALKILNPDGRTVGLAKPIEPAQSLKNVKLKASHSNAGQVK